jgi:hypothetical protein
VEAGKAALVDLSNKEAETLLAAAEKQKADAEKKRADAVLFEIIGANGLVCRWPTWVVPHPAWIRGIHGGDECRKQIFLARCFRKRVRVLSPCGPS